MTTVYSFILGYLIKDVERQYASHHQGPQRLSAPPFDHVGRLDPCQRRYNFIRDPDFKAGLVVLLIDLLEGVHWITQFPWMVKTMQLLPDSLVGWLDPRMKNRELSSYLSLSGSVP